MPNYQDPFAPFTQALQNQQKTMLAIHQIQRQSELDDLQKQSLLQQLSGSKIQQKISEVTLEKATRDINIDKMIASSYSSGDSLETNMEKAMNVHLSQGSVNKAMDIGANLANLKQYNIKMKGDLSRQAKEVDVYLTTKYWQLGGDKNPEAAKAIDLAYERLKIDNPDIAKLVDIENIKKAKSPIISGETPDGVRWMFSAFNPEKIQLTDKRDEEDRELRREYVQSQIEANKSLADLRKTKADSGPSKKIVEDKDIKNIDTKIQNIEKNILAEKRIALSSFPVSERDSSKAKEKIREIENKYRPLLDTLRIMRGRRVRELRGEVGESVGYAEPESTSSSPFDVLWGGK